MCERKIAYERSCRGKKAFCQPTGSDNAKQDHICTNVPPISTERQASLRSCTFSTAGHLWLLDATVGCVAFKNACRRRCEPTMSVVISGLQSLHLLMLPHSYFCSTHKNALTLFTLQCYIPFKSDDMVVFSA